MLQILRQPFPSDKKTIQALRMCIMASICVWAVFYFIKPFGLGLSTDTIAATMGLKFALVTLVLSLFCTIVVPFLFPALFDEKHWTVFMEIMFLLTMVLFIAMGNVWLTTWLFGNPVSAGLVLNTIKYTLVIGSAPVLLSVLVKQQRLLAKYSREARLIEESMAKPASHVTAMPADGANSAVAVPPNAGGAPVNKEAPLPMEEARAAMLETAAVETLPPVAPVLPLHLKGDNLSENLQLAAADFLFAAAADNYTNIYYLKDGVVQQVLFRVSVKILAEQAAVAGSIFRCHKSFLVNLQQVTHISGNAQGYKLHLQQNEFTVPVSRSLNAQIKQQLQELYQKK